VHAGYAGLVHVTQREGSQQLEEVQNQLKCSVTQKKVCAGSCNPEGK